MDEIEEVETVVPDKKKPVRRPRSKAETRKRRIANATVQRQKLLEKIEATRHQVRSTRLAPGERAAQRQVIADALADLRELDRRIHWLTNAEDLEADDSTE